MKDMGKITEIRPDIGTVAFKGMVSKTAQGDHLPERIQIFVHNGTSLKKCTSTVRVNDERHPEADG